MKLSKEIKTGLLALIAIALIIFGYNFLKGENILEKTRTFYAVYDDVEGLSSSSPVTINGLQVGNVSKIEFLNREAKLVVSFNVKNNFEFSKSSVAKIYGGDLIGGKSIAIEPNFNNQKPAVSGDTLTSEVEGGLFELVNDKLTPLQFKVENAVTGIDSLVASLNFVLDIDSKQSIKSSIAEFETTLKSFNQTTKKINGLLDENESKFGTTMNNLEHASANFAGISDSLAALEIQPMFIELKQNLQNLNSVTSKLEKGEGSLGKLLDDDGLYDNLEASAKQMEELLQDMKLNPKRYVHFSIFGKKNKAYSQPEDDK
ncbi:MlaD family protein [Psychroflexus maritimus]|uniref:MCE family protein n=1 Tax=Psychroflexus maritimus TaxID=2714865 RepID=A0A967AEB7_9FLAO|nr:MlaD family protein [Psychroflexus maritimus]NGZ90722.1 MCE family protein [Psychroflexus maritimus]